MRYGDHGSSLRRNRLGLNDSGLFRSVCPHMHVLGGRYETGAFFRCVRLFMYAQTEAADPPPLSLSLPRGQRALPVCRGVFLSVKSGEGRVVLALKNKRDARGSAVPIWSCITTNVEPPATQQNDYSHRFAYIARPARHPPQKTRPCIPRGPPREASRTCAVRRMPKYPSGSHSIQHTVYSVHVGFLQYILYVHLIHC